MATVPCPSCGLPRAEDLFGVAACPVCGNVGPLADEIADEAPPAEPAADTNSGGSCPPLARANSGLIAGTLLGFVAGVTVGVAGVLGWQAFGDRLLIADTPNVAPADPTPSEPPAEPSPQPGAPASSEPVAAPVTPPPPAPAPPNTTPGTGEVQPPPAKEPVAVGPAPQPVPPNPFRPALPPAMRLDNPGGTSAPFVRPGGMLVLRGQVRKLVVSGLEAGAVLDCSDLEAQEVVVVGKVDGGSQLSVRAPGGKVTFHGKVDGNSKVRVSATGGAVTFAGPGDPHRDGATIAGGAAVEVTARAVDFPGRIAGAGTKVSVTLTSGGSLSFAEVSGPARLEYAKAHPDDPNPTVTKGKVSPPAVVTRVD